MRDHNKKNSLKYTFRLFKRVGFSSIFRRCRVLLHCFIGHFHLTLFAPINGREQFCGSGRCHLEYKIRYIFFILIAFPPSTWMYQLAESKKQQSCVTIRNSLNNRQIRTPMDTSITCNIARGMRESMTFLHTSTFLEDRMATFAAQHSLQVRRTKTMWNSSYIAGK